MEGEIAVGAAASGRLVDTSLTRRNLRFSAPKGNTGSVFIKPTKAVTVAGKDMGHELQPGAVWFLNADDDKDINKAWYGIASLGTQSVVVIVVQ